MKAKILYLILIMSLIFSAFPAAVNAAGADPYTTVLATQYDNANIPDSKKQPSYVAMTRSLNSWICFEDMNFTDSPYAISVMTATSTDYLSNNIYEIHLDSPTGPVISTVYVTEVETWGVPVENIGVVTEKVTGVHDIYIATNSPNDFYSFSFLAVRKGETAYKPYSETNAFTDIEENKAKDAINALYALGAAEASEINADTYLPNLPMRRIEYAKMVAALMTDEIPENSVTEFTDINSDDIGYDAVNYLYQNGILRLNSEKTFKPYEFITVREACAMILRWFGYEQLCEYKGGYPNGYDTLARELRITAGLNMNDFLRRGSAAEILYSSLDAEYLEISSIENENVTYEKKTGILEQTRNIIKGRGIVTITPYSALVGGVDLLDGVCYIENIRFKTGDIDPGHYLGVNCDFFYKYDSQTGDNTLIYITPAKNVKQEILNSKDNIEIFDISETNITYSNKGGKTRKIAIPSKAKWIYNNRVLTKSISMVVTPESFRGTIRVIDNGNGYETVFVEEYINIKIQSYDSFKKLLVDELSGKTYNFYNKKLILSDGKVVVKEEKIEKGSLAELYLSDDEEIAVLLFGESTFTGLVDEIDSDGRVRVGDKIYYKANEFTDTVTPGYMYKFFLNRHGEIVYSESADDTKLVGLLADLKKDNDKIYISVITSENGKVDFEAADKLWVDGYRFSEYEEIRDGNGSYGGLISTQQYYPVLYKLNSDNKITMIDTLTDGAKNENDTLNALNTYNENELYYYRSEVGAFSYYEGFRLQYPAKAESDIILVNEFYESSPDCYFDTLKNYSSGQHHSFIFLCRERGEKIADIIFSPAYKNHRHNSFVVVESVTPAINKEGVVGLNINTKSGAADKIYWVSPENTTYYNYAKSLESGDMIAVFTDMNEEVSKFEVGVFRNGAASNSAGLSAKVSKGNGISGSGNLSENFVYGVISSTEDDYIEIDAFGSDIPYWCRIQGNSIYRISDEIITYGETVNILKPGDTIILRFDYTLQWAAVFE